MFSDKSKSLRLVVIPMIDFAFSVLFKYASSCYFAYWKHRNHAYLMLRCCHCCATCVHAYVLKTCAYIVARVYETALPLWPSTTRFAILLDTSETGMHKALPKTLHPEQCLCRPAPDSVVVPSVRSSLHWPAA